MSEIIVKLKTVTKEPFIKYDPTEFSNIKNLCGVPIIAYRFIEPDIDEDLHCCTVDKDADEKLQFLLASKNKLRLYEFTFSYEVVIYYNNSSSETEYSDNRPTIDYGPIKGVEIEYPEEYTLCDKPLKKASEQDIRNMFDILSHQSDSNIDRYLNYFDDEWNELDEPTPKNDDDSN